MILGRASRRYLLRHPLLLFLSVLGVALGVAVVVAIDLANSSAEQAFRLSVRAVSGRATHEIVGASGGVDEKLYQRLRVEGGIRQSAPVLEGYAAVPSHPGHLLRIFGIDPLAEAPFRTYTPAPGMGNFSRLLTEPGTALLHPATAERLNLKEGERFEIEIGGRRHLLLLGGGLEASDEVSARALESLAVVDIATAQELLGRLGRLSRIDLQVPEGREGELLLDRVRTLLPPGVMVQPAGGRADALAGMTRAFRLNLTALSLLALVVGMFLIYNTLSFSVLQRRELLGALRTLGVTRREIFSLVLGEAAVIGAAGTVLGLLLGFALGSGLLHLVTRTINDLYFVLAVRDLSLSPFSLAKGILLGLGASVAAALVPAREAAMSAPRTVIARSAVESRQKRLAPLAAAAGGGLMLLGGGLLAGSGRSIPLAFVALFALISGYALMVPGATSLLLRLLQPPAAVLFGLLGRMAARDLASSLSRTGVATAALVVAVSATIGMGIMIGSFRLTLVHWLQSYLQADVYVTVAGEDSAARTPLESTVVERLSTLPGVSFVTRARHLSLPAAGEPTALFVVDMPAEGFTGYDFRRGDPESIRKRLVSSEAVIISEPFAYRLGLKEGDEIRLPTEKGERTFSVAGIFTDYSTDRGRVVMSRPVFERFWSDREVDALGIYLVPGHDSEELADAARRAVGTDQQITVYSNAGLRRASLETFDRTFAITAVLRLLAVIIAFVGILSALLSMQVERARELAVLRAIGLTPGQLWGLVNGETALVGLLAGVLALPLGLIQALVLIHVINRRSFGWTLQTHFDPAILLQSVVLALGAALLAGLYPAWRMARTTPALALREE